MIKAKDAKAISRSAVLDQHILDRVNFAIIAEASVVQILHLYIKK